MYYGVQSMTCKMLARFLAAGQQGSLAHSRPSLFGLFFLLSFFSSFFMGSVPNC